MKSVALKIASFVVGLSFALATPSALAANRQVSSVSHSFSARSVAVGGSLKVTGVVAPGVRRSLQLQRRMGDQWVTFKTAVTDASGHYSVSVNTRTFVGQADYRVFVPQTNEYQEAATTAAGIEIHGAGKTTSRSFLMGTVGDQPYRWNPCAPVHVRVNPTGAPSHYLNDIKGALARVNEQSGLQLRYDGSTSIVPAKGRTSYPGGIDLVIAFVKPGRTDYFPTGTGAVGYGGARGRYTVDPVGKVTAELDTGFVLLHRGVYAELDPGFTAGEKLGWRGTRGQLLMHELGHAVGMGHADDDTKQVMYPTMQDRAAVWGAGDAANLSQLGLASGCIDSASSSAASSSTMRLAAPEDRASIGILD